jgi:hypothetical protein
MGVRPISLAHPLDRGRKQIVADKNVSALREKTEDQPRHEVVHVVAPCRRSPIGILFQKLDIEFVQAPGGSDVERIVADRLGRRNAGEDQEKGEAIGKVGIGAS